MVLPAIASHFVGRMALHTLWPLVRREIETMQEQESVVDLLLGDSHKYIVVTPLHAGFSH